MRVMITSSIDGWTGILPRVNIVIISIATNQGIKRLEDHIREPS